jgi:tetratricopeptide (TPR) repeat protein
MTILKENIGQCFKDGRFDEAIALIKASLKKSPNDWSLLFYLGLAYMNQSKHDEAILHFKLSHQLHSSNYLPLFYMGVIHQRNENHVLAIDFFDQAKKIDAGDADIYFSLGLSYQRIGKTDAALSAYDETLKYKSDHVLAHQNRGILLYEVNRYVEAIDEFIYVINLNPKFYEAYQYITDIYIEQDRAEEALRFIEKINTEDHEGYSLYYIRGMVLVELFCLKDGIVELKKSFNLNNEHLETYFYLAKAYFFLDMFDEAERWLNLAILKFNQHKNRSTVYGLLGQISFIRRQLDKAIGYLDEAINLDPGNRIAKFHKATILLSQGRFEDGWGLYENRPLNVFKYRHLGKAWLGGEELNNKKILIYSEQGLGDVIQFFRYVKIIQAMGAKVTFQSYPELIPVLKEAQNDIRFIEKPDPGEDFDFNCALLSLPFALKTSIDSIPSEIPYIFPNRQLTDKWLEILKADKTRFKVGLVWSGGFRPNLPGTWPENGRRNIPLEKFKALKDVDVNFYSLQKGQPAEFELSELVKSGWGGPKIINYTDKINSFSDTLAFIDCLDLIISVDTSTAHLASALGKPLWMLNRYDSCWRWLDGREDSPWYPSMKIYTQSKLGDWEDVLSKVLYDLNQLNKVTYNS